MGKIIITIDVPDGMEDVVKSLLEKEAKLINEKAFKSRFQEDVWDFKGKEEKHR
ncbi:hypothetical protein NF865_02135 [Thermococcus aggregans]|uniref:Uncharacterized protein n=1 Tax=Thermococcus aggregans TaxID=110163 RepID=A0A9E7MY42_THEAG|nr:hypothetical protein [Thermococcus aggregans]USS41038.1 hypothetical protein NF865_02135 [Thermococcus aggregans]